MKKIYATIGLLSFVLGCQNAPQQTQDLPAKSANEKTNNEQSAFKPVAQWNQYWYDGKAELTSFKLMQSRYGQIHEGEATTIFVTEDFSAAKQVKLDDASKAGADKVPMLKMNLVKKFQTGIYPYSLMTSVFTPTDASSSLKLTTSGQEWCGHVFMQLNLQANAYRYRGFSYFESEGDEDRNIEKAILEDEVWNLIRLNPSLLPTGKVRMIPSSLVARLAHFKMDVTDVEASLTEEKGEMVYTLKYALPIERTLTIRFEKAFPHHILGWSDAYQNLTTVATQKKSIRLDYWTKHNNEDRKLLELLN